MWLPFWNISWRVRSALMAPRYRRLASIASLILVTKEVELLLRAVVLTGEAEQLEQERPFLGVCRIVAKLRSEKLDRFVQLPIAK